jgi:hypothetical protein
MRQFPETLVFLAVTLPPGLRQQGDESDESLSPLFPR